MKDIEIYTGYERSDCERIQRILLDRGYNATLQQCDDLWSSYSDSMCAGWMRLNKEDEDVFNNVVYQITN